jgi:predicted DNA-binding transcriptional regulator YafY
MRLVILQNRLSIPFNDSRELMMEILKHGAEVEVKAPHNCLMTSGSK